jgi:hypothetical protein
MGNSDPRRDGLRHVSRDNRLTEHPLEDCYGRHFISRGATIPLGNRSLGSQSTQQISVATRWRLHF